MSSALTAAFLGSHLNCIAFYPQRTRNREHYSGRREKADARSHFRATPPASADWQSAHAPVALSRRDKLPAPVGLLLRNGLRSGHGVTGPPAVRCGPISKNISERQHRALWQQDIHAASSSSNRISVAAPSKASYGDHTGHGASEGTNISPFSRATSAARAGIARIFSLIHSASLDAEAAATERHESRQERKHPLRRPRR